MATATITGIITIIVTVVVLAKHLKIVSMPVREITQRLSQFVFRSVEKDVLKNAVQIWCFRDLTRFFKKYTVIFGH